MMLCAQDVAQMSGLLEDRASGSTVVKLEGACAEIEANVRRGMIECQLRDLVQFRRCITIDHRRLTVGSCARTRANAAVVFRRPPESAGHAEHISEYIRMGNSHVRCRESASAGTANDGTRCAMRNSVVSAHPRNELPDHELAEGRVVDEVEQPTPGKIVNHHDNRR